MSPPCRLSGRGGGAAGWRCKDECKWSEDSRRSGEVVRAPPPPLPLPPLLMYKLCVLRGEWPLLGIFYHSNHTVNQDNATKLPPLHHRPNYYHLTTQLLGTLPTHTINTSQIKTPTTLPEELCNVSHLKSNPFKITTPSTLSLQFNTMP